jgi:ankyrin repeat protein
MQQLPEAPSLEWLRKQAKRMLVELKRERPDAKLADAQLAIARDYGFPSWRALKGHVDSLSFSGQIFQLAREGNVIRLAAILDEHPDAIHAREAPYSWTLLHAAAQMGHLGVVNLLLDRGLDVNTKEQGDNTTALHWAAAAGKVDVVRRLLEAGVDPVGAGDDHELTAIGWATCWFGTDTSAHKEVVRLLLAAGARHTIFSAIGADDASAVRKVIADIPSALAQRMSRNENGRLPLHHAAIMNRPRMVRLLLELGADPTATDDAGADAMAYTARPEGDPDVVLALAGGKPTGIYAALVARDHDSAESHIRKGASLDGGTLHMLVKRNDIDVVRWLVARGASPNALWNHFGAMLTPMHLATMVGNMEMLRLLLDAGGDPSIRDSQHEGDVAGWANHHGRQDMVHAIEAHLRG